MTRKRVALLLAWALAYACAYGAFADFCPHTETFWDVVQEPTCTQDGAQIKRCRACGEQIGLPYSIPALGHEPGDWITEGGDCVHDVTVSRFCTRCGQLLEHTTTPNSKHTAGDWHVIREATRDQEGLREKRCIRCGCIMDTETIPRLSSMKYRGTACSQGPRFRDVRPKLTDKWNMYTPLDLSREGTLTVPLVASNQYVIGTVLLESRGGKVTVSYETDIAGVNVRSEFLTFFSDLESVVTIEPSELTAWGFPLGTPFSIQKGLLGDTSVLMYLALLVDYDTDASGIRDYSHGNDLDRPLVPSGAAGPTPRPTTAPPEPGEAETGDYPTLTVGSTDPAVQRLKNRLFDLGYTRIRQQGNHYTAATALAVKAFQTVSGLTADGVATPETQALLFSKGARRKP